MADLDIEQTPRRRGRPKGTGIDDSHVLRRISDMMSADKSLKPTTAIKQCGIDNPSIVRRLREKLKTSPPNARKAMALRRTSATTPAPQKPVASPTPPKSENPVRPQVVAPPPSDPTSPQISPPEFAAKEAQKAREAALLAAYLKALHQTAVPPLDEERSESGPRRDAAAQPVSSTPPPQPQTMHQSERPQPGQPQNPFTSFQHPSGSGMMFPFFPPFMQPFAPKPPPPNPMAQSQMEALKLSVEVMTAVTKLQMFTYQNALAATPFGNMLQAQTMMGQMLLASFAGFSGFAKKPDNTK